MMGKTLYSKTVFNLLNEAASAETDETRLIQIGDELEQCLWQLDPDAKPDPESRTVAYRSMFRIAWSDTAKNHRELLPYLFPTFAMLCGNRISGNALRELDGNDWEIFKDFLGTQA